MAGLSKVILIGNLGRDPETRYTPNGTMNVQFTMAVSRRFRDQSGQDQERTSWYRVTGWGRLAETLDNLSQRGFLTKGKQVYVEGRLEPREYQDQQGQTRTSLDVNLTELLLLGSRMDEGAGGPPSGERAGRGNQQEGAEEFGNNPSFDDVPF